MKEKFVNIWEDIKEYVTENPDELIIWIYGIFTMAILGVSVRSIALFNKKTRLEIEKLSR